jgi:hypothetical protein
MKRILFFLFVLSHLCAAEKMYFATVTDTEHYEWALNLIATIHRHNFSRLEEIAVFDLGMTEGERQELSTLAKVKVYAIEPVNPHLFTKFQVHPNGKQSRGWYSWKPVVIKQALDLFPEVLYLDAGITLCGPSDLLFAHLRQNGCLLIDCGHTIRRMTPQSIIEKLSLDAAQQAEILDRLGLSAGCQGLTQGNVKDYILPLYQMAHDLSYFIDDGTAPKGFGWARHDQTLFSIQARRAQLPVLEGVRKGKIFLKIDGKKREITLEKFLKFTRDEFDLNKTQKFLKYKNLSQ